MKKLYFLCFLLVTAYIDAQIINFPDAAFKAKLLLASPSNNIARIYVWPPVNNQNYINVAIDTNGNGEIEVSEAAAIDLLNVSNSNISSMVGIEYFTHLESLNCSFNQLTGLALGATGSENLRLDVNCGDNQLTSIDCTGVVVSLSLFCQNNQLTSLDFSNLSNTGLTLTCSNNPLTNLEFGNYQNLILLTCSNTLLSVLDISGNYRCEYLQCQNNPNLSALMIKDAVTFSDDMGDTWPYFEFQNNPNLQYLCVSENRLGEAQTRLNQYGYTNCALNSYCDFNAGSPFYAVQGTNTLDSNGDGCEASDGAYPNLRFAITNGNVSGTIPTSSGAYAVSVVGGSHVITPMIEMPNYYTVSPSSLTVSFPSQVSPVTQNFCIAPNGNHADVEVTLFGNTTARPGFDSSYTLLLRNKGTTTETGAINFSFDDAVCDFVSSTTAPTSQSVGNITLNYSNLAPFQTMMMEVILNINSPTEIPPVNDGDVLTSAASVTTTTIDELPSDNTFTLHQTVVNSVDPNDKTCLEGNTVAPDMIGAYVHYMVRFENTGTANAQNVVVKDVIDIAKFDVSSLVPLVGSHPFVTRMVDANKVEFIFENIQLPFDDANNDGYIVFKIKTKPTLVVGDTFSNTANIYFDYNFPIVTNTATTTIQSLGNPDFDFGSVFTLSPVPTGNTLAITSNQAVEIKSVSIFNMLGQLLQIETNPNESIDVSGLKTGSYFIRLDTDKGAASSKFIKE